MVAHCGALLWVNLPVEIERGSPPLYFIGQPMQLCFGQKSFALPPEQKLTQEIQFPDTEFSIILSWYAADLLVIVWLLPGPLV